MRQIYLCLLIASLFFSEITYATGIADIGKDKELNFSAYLDASYNYLERSNQFTSEFYNRSNDVEPNGFSLQQIYLDLSRQPAQGFGGLLEAVIGRDANELQLKGMNPNVFGIQNIGLAIPQAYLQYVKNTFTLRGGDLYALSGLETEDYRSDTNFSHSILYGFAQNGSHIGLRAIETLNDQVSLTAGIGNGWNTIEQVYHQDIFEYAINYTPNSRFSFIFNGYTGQNYLDDSLNTGPKGVRNAYDVIATLFITQKLNLAMNYDYGIQNRALLPSGDIGQAVWQGVAGYINYLFNDKWRISLRGEIFADSDGYTTGIRQNWRELTFTLGYTVIKGLQIFAETRHDFSNVNSFLNKDRIGSSNNQQSFALNVLYEF
jgi:hypothetical protein